jgi:hypothetical protein
MKREEDVRMGHTQREEDAQWWRCRTHGALVLVALEPSLTGWANLCRASGASLG